LEEVDMNLGVKSATVTVDGTKDKILNTESEMINVDKEFQT